MKILIAEDDEISRELLGKILRQWKHDLVVAADGLAAWQALQVERVDIALLDWIMPGLDGLQLCRQIRTTPALADLYLVLLTARTSKADVMAGLQAGADDYVIKPFNREELQARLQVGQRMLGLQQRLEERVRELQETLAQVRQLQELVPICSYCKKIRDDKNYWQQVETYVAARTAARFSHAICPACWTSEVEPQLAKVKLETAQGCLH